MIRALSSATLAAVLAAASLSLAPACASAAVQETAGSKIVDHRATGGAKRLSQAEIDAWKADLEFLRAKLPEAHANLFHTLTSEAFNAAVDDLEKRVPELSHHEIIVELAAIVASVGDGHTRLTLPLGPDSGFFQGHSSTPAPKNPAMMFHTYPIRLYAFADGVYIRSAADARYAGAEVLRIGGVSIDEAWKAVDRVVHRDNDSQARGLIPRYLVVSEVLHALGLIEDMAAARFEVRTEGGSVETLTLAPTPLDAQLSWVDGGSADRPLHLKNREDNYWFEYLPASNVVYFQYNEVVDKPDESIADFALRLEAALAEHEARALIIDLRYNPGGNNSLNLSVLHALIRSPQLRKPGSLFVITGRETFSAALMFTLDLERHTPAIFVGEPTGGRPIHYGDSRKVELPNSGLTIRASSLFWQYSDPRDERDAVVPHVEAEPTAMDYRTGRDPALEKIFDLIGPASGSRAEAASPEGAWSGRLLEYEIVVNVERDGDGWRGTLDFPSLDATGLPLINVSFDAPTLRFDFENGDEVIPFEGDLRGDYFVGSAFMEGQLRPVVTRRN